MKVLKSGSIKLVASVALFLALFIYPVIAYTQFRINENQTTIGAIDKEPERLAVFYRKRCKRCQKVLCGKCLEVK